MGRLILLLLAASCGLVFLYRKYGVRAVALAVCAVTTVVVFILAESSVLFRGERIREFADHIYRGCDECSSAYRLVRNGRANMCIAGEQYVVTPTSQTPVVDENGKNRKCATESIRFKSDYVLTRNEVAGFVADNINEIEKHLETIKKEKDAEREKAAEIAKHVNNGCGVCMLALEEARTGLSLVCIEGEKHINNNGRYTPKMGGNGKVESCTENLELHIGDNVGNVNEWFRHPGNLEAFNKISSSGNQ